MPEKLQIHPSGVETFAGCGVAYENRYIKGIKTPPAAAMIVGTAVDKSVNADLTSKKETGELLSAEQVKDNARDALETGWQGEVLLDEGESKDNQIDKAIDLAATHHKELAPGIEPLEVNWRWSLDVKGRDFQLAGETDIVERTRIRDTKTSKKSPGKDTAHDDLKLTAYLLAEKAYGRDRDEAILDYVWKTPGRGELKTRVLPTTRSGRDYHAFLNRVQRMSEALKAGIFMPARQGNNWMCSERWCGYWNTCPFARAPKSVAVPNEDLGPLLVKSIEQAREKTNGTSKHQ